VVSAPAFGLLLVGPSVAADPATLASPYGSFRPSRCDSLDDVEAALALQPADVVLIRVDRDGGDALATWPGLVDLTRRMAVVVLAEAPTPAWALQLVGAGVQDVVPEAVATADPTALSRLLRFAIERHGRERAARVAASTDLLTGLPNQTQLVEHMSQLLALREREPAPMLVIALRVDGPARVEAEFGREAGNALRRKIAVRLRSGMRAGDVVASTGVDRFAVLLPHVQSAEDGARVVEKLSASLQAPIGLMGQQLVVSVTAGVAQYPRDGKDATVLLRVAADAASRLGASEAAAVSHRSTRAEAANDD
jgi:diguanylate cyclase (GGDEF)-like protein